MEQFIITRQQIDQFIQKLQTEGKSHNVIAEYQRNLNRLYQTAEKNNYMLDQDVLAAWRTEQIDQGIADGTVTNRTVKVNHFLRYLKLDELCFQKGRKQDLRGQQFGSLIAIEPTTHKSADRSIYWKCRCKSCGKEKEIPANQLKKGVQVSCGCERAKRLQETNGYIEGTCLKNVFSDKTNSNNTSGHKGVYLKRGKWAAKIQYKKKSYYLGAYDRIEDAIDARRLAENWVKDDAQTLLDKIKEMQSQHFRKGHI